MTQKKYHLLRHIQRVRFNFSFTIEEQHLDSLSQWALETNSILFLPDGTVRDPNGQVLFCPGSLPPDTSSEVPFLKESYVRRAKTENYLKERNIFAPSLPPLPCELEISLRSFAEVFNRAMALFVVALWAESFATKEPMERDFLRDQFPLGFSHLSLEEKEFLSTEDPDESQVIQFAWRYEAVALLLWALGVFPELSFPESICDVPKVAKLAMESTFWQNNARLRSTCEVLDCLDLHFRLHWLCRQAEINGDDLPFEIDRGVVQERHYALNWLIGFEDADWDDVTTPT